MKLLFSHIADLDGVTPVILLKLLIVNIMENLNYLIIMKVITI